MAVSLDALGRRVDEVEGLAEEGFGLAEGVQRGEHVQDVWARRSQQWYRGARAFLVQHDSSGLREFDACYDTSKRPDAERGEDGRRWRRQSDIEDYLTFGTRGTTLGFTPCRSKCEAWLWRR